MTDGQLLMIANFVFYALFAIGMMFLGASIWMLRVSLIEYKSHGDHLVRIRELEIELEAMKRSTHQIQLIDPVEMALQKNADFQKPPTKEEIENDDADFENVF